MQEKMTHFIQVTQFISKISLNKILDILIKDKCIFLNLNNRHFIFFYYILEKKYYNNILHQILSLPKNMRILFYRGWETTLKNNCDSHCNETRNFVILNNAPSDIVDFEKADFFSHCIFDASELTAGINFSFAIKSSLKSSHGQGNI